MTVFDQAFVVVVGVEGVLSLDKNDPGNYRDGVLVGTKYGIAAKYHPGVDIVNLTLDQAKAIHQAEYWGPAGCDWHGPRAALCAYDCAINQGPPIAVDLFQQACGIPIDGKLGPQTKQAFMAATDYHTAEFMALRALRYAHTMNFAVDGTSWFRRLFVTTLAFLTSEV